MDPALIAEQRDQIESLISRLLHCRAGFGDILAAIVNPNFQPSRGAGAGRFSMNAYCRQKGIPRREGMRLMQAMREALQARTPSPPCSRTAQRIAKRFALA